MSSCSIEEEQEVTITGGSRSGKGRCYLCNFGFQPIALDRTFLNIFEGLLVLQNFFHGSPLDLKKYFFQIVPPPLIQEIERLPDTK